MKCYVCGKDINHTNAAVEDEQIGYVGQKDLKIPTGHRHKTCNRPSNILQVEGEVVARHISEKSKTKPPFKTFKKQFEKYGTGKDIKDDESEGPSNVKKDKKI
jgi:hypothetical protein